MAGLNSTTFGAATKILYAKGVEAAVMERSPTLAIMEKFEMPGASWDFVINVSHSGASADFTTAQAQKQAATRYAFRVTRSKVYAHGSIDGETGETATGMGAVAEAVKSALEDKVNDVTHYLSHSIWTAQGGAVGVVGSVSTTSLTLATIADHVKFNVDDELQASTTNTSASTAHSSGASATVTAINRETGVLTSDSNWTTQISSLAANDFLFKKGSVGQGAAGILAWISPDASPGSLYGVTRTTDRNRLAGCRFDATGLDPLTAIIQAKAIGRENSKGGNLDLLIVSPRRYADIETALESKAVPCKVSGKTLSGVSVGFEAIRFGSTTILEDPFCPHEYALLTKRKGVWKCGQTKSGLPHFQTNGSGSKLYPEPSEDADQFRLRGYFAPVCKSPVNNVLVGWDGFS